MSKNTSKLNKKKIFLVLLVAFVLLEAGIFISSDSRFFQGSTLTSYAGQILEKCSGEGYRPSCYDREIPKLMDAISMEETFRVTKLIQERDSEYWYCHVLAHDVSGLETAKDPDNWKDVVARCPNSMCSNGCLHGAFQERFRAESIPDAEISELKPELEGICESRVGWNPTGLDRGTCYHALGHLMMYITDANIQKSVGFCKELAIQRNGTDSSPLCFDGAFMQIFQPLEPEDFALVEGKQPAKEELVSFCNEFSGAEKGSCWGEGWPLFYEEIINPEGLVKFCSVMEPYGQEDRCYNALFYIIPVQFNLDEERIKNFCSSVIAERKGRCFAMASVRMIETDALLVDKSIGVCAGAEAAGVGEVCYEELLLYSTFNFHAGSENFFRLCNALPEPWNLKCLEQI